MEVTAVQETTSSQPTFALSRRIQWLCLLADARKE